jgi:Tat protein translocase TatB subunit
MFDIGLQEMVLIMVLALIVFGPSKLPELGKMIGRGMREFRKASDEFRTTVETNLKINEIDLEPLVPEGSGVGVTYPGGVAYPGPASAGGEGAASAGEVAPEAAESSTDTTGVAPVGAPETDGGEPYRAQRGSRLFHRRDCAWVARIPGTERIGFSTVADAKQEGYATCPVCEPWEAGTAS